MAFRHTLALLVGLASGLLLANPLPAAILTIDNFDVGSGAISASQGGSDSDTEGGLSPNVLGGVRDMAIPGGIGVVGPSSLKVFVSPSLGTLFFELGSQTSGSAVLTYDNLGAGLGGIDLTDSGSNGYFTMKIVDIDQGDLDITIRVEDTAATSEGVTTMDGGVGIIQIPFADFSGVDFTSIEKITLELAGPDATDLQIDTFYASAAVPEPASFAVWSLIGMSCLGFGWRRRST